MAAPHVHFSQQEDDGSPPRPVTLTILGCGALGTVILKGILASASHSQGLSEDGSLSATKTAISPLRDPSEPTELRKPTNFIACVRRPESALRVRKALDSSSQLANVQILHGENIRGVNAADIVLLGCKPSMVRDLLQLDGMRVALAGKLLISICAGVSVDQISHSLYGLPYSELFTSNGMTDPCRIVRIMPNIASHIRQSMTLVLNSEPPLPKRHQDMTDWIATRIGQLLHISRSSMDIGTTLCGSGPAFVAFLVDAFADGAVAMGLERSEAYLMIAGTMRGTAELILNGEHPAQIKEKVSTPGGSTIEGLLALENGGTSGIISRSVREATRKASQLGADNSATAGTDTERQ